MKLKESMCKLTEQYSHGQNNSNKIRYNKMLDKFIQNSGKIYELEREQEEYQQSLVDFISKYRLNEFNNDYEVIDNSSDDEQDIVELISECRRNGFFDIHNAENSHESDDEQDIVELISECRRNGFFDIHSL